MVLELLAHCRSGLPSSAIRRRPSTAFRPQTRPKWVPCSSTPPCGSGSPASRGVDAGRELPRADSLARLPSAVRPATGGADADYEAVRDDLDDLVYSRARVAIADDAARRPAHDVEETAAGRRAVPNNGQALMLSGRLHEAGIPSPSAKKGGGAGGGSLAGGCLRAIRGARHRSGSLPRGHVEACAVKPTIELDEAWRAVRRSADAGRRVHGRSLPAGDRRAMRSVADELNETARGRSGRFDRASREGSGVR